jgi:hypothetical protein
MTCLVDPTVFLTTLFSVLHQIPKISTRFKFQYLQPSPSPDSARHWLIKENISKISLIPYLKIFSCNHQLWDFSFFKKFPFAEKDSHLNPSTLDWFFSILSSSMIRSFLHFVLFHHLCLSAFWMEQFSSCFMASLSSASRSNVNSNNNVNANAWLRRVRLFPLSYFRLQ